MNQSQQRKCFRVSGQLVFYWLLVILPASGMAAENDQQQAQVVISNIIVNRSNIFEASGNEPGNRKSGAESAPVSYTHLTLPTILLV